MLTCKKRMFTKPTHHYLCAWFVMFVSLLMINHAQATNNALNFPPSAEINYQIQTVQAGLPISGNAKIIWQMNAQEEPKTYRIYTETSVALFGKIHSTQSQGNINTIGLMPLRFTEKRLRKAPTTTTFDYDNKRIQFSESEEIYELKGGEQDRTSAIWQLVTLARTTGQEVALGQQWKMVVAGNRDADPWVFKVVNKVTLHTALGELACLHILRSPPPDAKEQQLEVWLASELNYYPVQISFQEKEGDHIEQKITSIKNQK